MMDSGDKTRQKLSALADGELDASQAARLIKRLGTDDLRATWDVYHQIGDVLRTEAMTAAVSPGFSRRLAERLAVEPVVLAPKRGLVSRIGTWPTTLAAMAAAAFGFFIAPSLLDGRDGTLPIPASAPMASVSHGSLLADAGNPTVGRESADYLLMHQGSHPGLYGTAPLARPAILDTRSGP